MAIYSISDLEKLSGIKAHTIRIWEQRYGILNPKRTETNIRYYMDEDLKLLLNVALLNRNGFKISKIAKMDETEIMEKVTEISEVNFEHNTQLDALTISMIEMDEYKFDKIITTNIQQLGFEQTMLQVIYPFLEKLGLLWLTGSINPVQEAFISYLIRQKIIVAIDNEAFVTGNQVKKYMIYLPEGEMQELSLLFMHYLLKSRKNKVIYLGQNISKTELEVAHKIHKPDYIFTMITEPLRKITVQDYVEDIAKTFPESRILLSGYQVVSKGIVAPPNVSLITSLGQTIEFLNANKKVS